MGDIHQIVDGGIDGTPEVERHERGKQDHEAHREDQHHARPLIGGSRRFRFLVDEVLAGVDDLDERIVELLEFFRRGVQHSHRFSALAVVGEVGDLFQLLPVGFPLVTQRFQVRVRPAFHVLFHGVEGDVDLIAELGGLLFRIGPTLQRRRGDDGVFQRPVLGHCRAVVAGREDAVQVRGRDTHGAVVDIFQRNHRIDTGAKEHQDQQGEHDAEFFPDCQIVHKRNRLPGIK